MTTTAEIIAQAYRESNLIAIGALPNDKQVAEALARLNVLVSAAYGYEVGDPLTDWSVGKGQVWPADSFYREVSDPWLRTRPPANSRLVADSTSAITISLDNRPADGARMMVIDPAGNLGGAPITLDAGERIIEDAPTLLLNESGMERTWFYRADLGRWMRLTELDGTEEFPFPMAFDDYFITRLASRLNPRYGRALPEATVVEMALTLDKLRARYRQPVTVYGDPGAAMLTSRSDGRRFAPGRSYSGDY